MVHKDRIKKSWAGYFDGILVGYFDEQNLPVVMTLVPLFDMVKGAYDSTGRRFLPNNMAILVGYVEIQGFPWLIDALYFSS